MKMKSFIVALMALVSLTATAQQKKVVDRVDQRTVQEFDHQDVTQKFNKHAFITLQGGAQYGTTYYEQLVVLATDATVQLVHQVTQVLVQP